MKIIAMRGLPASGKTTKARGLMKSMGNAVRINFDDIRASMFNEWSGKKERLVRSVGQNTAYHALEAGYVPIIDNTNLSPSAQAMWADVARLSGSELVWYDVQTSLEECIARDALRQGKEQVGRAVIEKMALKAGMIQWTGKPVAIFDMDGTLANCDHRVHYLSRLEDKERHKKFYAECHLDQPFPVIVQWAKNLNQFDDGNEYEVIIVSGRPSDLCGQSTINWLVGHNIHFSHIFMRDGHDYRPDDVVKQEILDALLKTLPKEKIAFVVDDRPSVIRMWKSNGLTVYPARGAVEEF